MTRRERLMATIQGRAVDRPAFCFYEINGLDENQNDADPFNIYSHPSWRPLIELAREKTDRIVMRSASFSGLLADPMEAIAVRKSHMEGNSRITISTIKAGNRTLTSRTRRDRDVNTNWTEEHLLKNSEDAEAFLEVSLPDNRAAFDPAPVIQTEKELGDSGIVMLDTPDPLGLTASLFDMGEYTIVAMTDPSLFHRLMERFAAIVLPRIEAACAALPGRLWRIYGPEFATAPYLPPDLFREYACRYDQPMIDIIHRSGGYARIHCHGRLEGILDHIVSMGTDGLDPVEPPPQGDVELSYVRKNYGKNMVLFGNLEASDIENLPTPQFHDKIARALDEGTAGTGRGFVLQPSACPYGRLLSKLAMKNYEEMVKVVQG